MASNPEFITHGGVTVYRELRDNHRQAVPYSTVFSLDPYLNGRTFKANGKEAVKRKIESGRLPINNQE